jgi:hypothetical protein
LLTIAAMAIGLGTAPMAAQEREQRRELESRLRELREQLREVERQLRDVGGSTSFFGGVFMLSTNRAQLGVLVQVEADSETDRIGAFLQSVTEGSAAEEAGLQEGDIIISFDGERLAGRYPAADPDESAAAKKLIDLIGDKDPGDEVTIEYQRDGETHSTVVTLDERDSLLQTYSVMRPPQGFPQMRVPSVPALRFFGDSSRFGVTVLSLWGDRWADIELVRLNEDLGRYFGTSEGLLVISPPDNDELDLQAGDVILGIDGREPHSPSRAMRILRSYEEGETINIEIMRDRKSMTISYVVPERENNWSRFDSGRDWREPELEVPSLELEQIELLEAPHLELEHLMLTDVPHLELEHVELLDLPHLELISPHLEVPHLEVPHHLELVHPRRIRRID